MKWRIGGKAGRLVVGILAALTGVAVDAGLLGGQLGDALKALLFAL